MHTETSHSTFTIDFRITHIRIIIYQESIGYIDQSHDRTNVIRSAKHKPVSSFTRFFPFTKITEMFPITGHRMFQRQASVCQRNARLTAIAAEENRQALMLFTVVAAFLVCNIPRIVFKLNEVINYESIMRNHEMGCQVKYK